MSEQSQEENCKNEESKEYEFYRWDRNYEESSLNSHFLYSSDSCASEYAENPMSLVIQNCVTFGITLLWVIG